MAKSFGQALRELRENRGYSINKLADKTGVSAAHISRLENGKRPAPSPRVIEKFSQVLGSYEKLMIAAGYHSGAYGLGIGADEYKHEQSKYLTILKEESNNDYCEAALPPGAVPVEAFVEIPIYGEIAAGRPALAEQNIIGYEKVPAGELNGGKYFYLIVKGDSMIGSRIYPGDKVLVREQPDVENGQIAVVIVNGDEATLKRVKYIEEAIILLPDNPVYEPQIYRADEVRIIGVVKKVEFDPNNRKA